MKKTALLLVLLLEGCALGARLVNVPLGLMGASYRRTPQRPEWGGATAEQLGPDGKAYWNGVYAQDHAACHQLGWAYQTTTYNAGWSGGVGAASGMTLFNEPVYYSCMQGKGWTYGEYALRY